MDLQKLSKKEWYLERFDGCPAFTEMTGTAFTKQRNIIPVYAINICIYKKGRGYWLSLPTDHKRIGGGLVKIYLRNKKVVTDLYKKWQSEVAVMMKNFYEWQAEDLTGLSDKLLIDWKNKVHQFYRELPTVPGFIDGFMFYADKRFDYLIKNFCAENKIKNYPRIYSILSAPIDPSFINEEENDLGAIISKLVKVGLTKKNAKIFLKNNPVAKGYIAKHLIKYSWIKSSYFGYKEYALADAIEEIYKILSQSKKKNNTLAENKKHKLELLKKYKFGAEILAIKQLTEIIVKWQDQRKIYTLTFVTLHNKLLKEISRRIGISGDLLNYTESRGLEKIINKKFKPEILKKREQGCLFIYQNGKIVDILSGKKALDFLKKVSRIKVADVKEITGMTASLGYAKGRVKIIMSAAQINLVKQGDILVAPMTRPEHLPGMKKAAAIVTDDGGITCHAAIVARELGIPCIIGTRIATQVLHDGDLVEVDANKGIIKIIS